MQYKANNRHEKIIIAFDLDGVLVDNVAFEHSVTNYILKQLSYKKNISFEEAQIEWNRVLQLHNTHPRWHDYSLHCEHLDLGDIWKDAHLKNAHLLEKYPHIDVAISIASSRCKCWIITDATEWVAMFKLSSIGLSSAFSEVFSSSRCGYSKSFDDFWDSIALNLPSHSSPLVFIENRLDNIHMAKRHIARCLPIWIDTPDHSQEIGFHALRMNTNETEKLQVSTHDSLPERLNEIIEKCYLNT